MGPCCRRCAEWAACTLAYVDRPCVALTCEEYVDEKEHPGQAVMFEGGGRG